MTETIPITTVADTMIGEVRSTVGLDDAVKYGRGFASFISNLDRSDPEIARAFAAVTDDKSLLASKTVWMPAAAWIVSWLATHLVLGISGESAAMLASVLAWGFAIAGRWMATTTIKRVFPAALVGSGPISPVRPIAGAPEQTVRADRLILADAPVSKGSSS